MTFTAMQLGDNVTITVQITRNYGPLSLTLGVSAECEVLNEAARQRAINEMTDTLMLEHRRQVERLKPTSSNKSGPPSSGDQMSPGNPTHDGTPSAATEIIDVDYIDVEEKGGKKYYKVMGGKFKRYGVRIWPEDEEVTGGVPELNFAYFGTGRHPVKAGYRALVSMAGDKPLKVLQILPAEVDF